MAGARPTFGRGRAPAASGATLDDCLAEAGAGRPAPVYLFDGDAFLALRAARELAHALVPEPQRTFNLVELDAAASPGEVAGELRTRGLFATGAKVVLVQEPAFLASKEDVEESFARAAEQWGEGRQREAARRLLALAGKAGLQAADLVPPAGEDPAKARAALAKRFKREFGFALDDAGLAFVEAAAAFAVEREMKPPKDDTSALDELLSAGLPPGHVLVVAAGKVDAKLPLVKKLVEAGRRVKAAIEREANFEARPILGPAVASLLAGTGKRADPAAVERLRELVDADARALATELAKLAAYVGDRKVIEVADVDAVVPRVAADPFFALGNAVEARDLPEALAVVDRALADGGHPIMLLSTAAGTLRRLVLEKERARKAAGDRRLASVREWESIVFPTIPAEELGKKKPYGFWMKYQASTRFSLGELLDALAGLAEADVAMKSGQDGRMALERVLVALLAPETRGRKTP